jgi:hypothetical protein
LSQDERLIKPDAPSRAVCPPFDEQYWSIILGGIDQHLDDKPGEVNIIWHRYQPRLVLLKALSARLAGMRVSPFDRQAKGVGLAVALDRRRSA